MPSHRHKWVWLVPKVSELQASPDQRVDYWLDYRSLRNIAVCTVCSKTGHQIKSIRGGIRVNVEPNDILQRAQALADKYGFKLPI